MARWRSPIVQREPSPEPVALRYAHVVAPAAVQGRLRQVAVVRGHQVELAQPLQVPLAAVLAHGIRGRVPDPCGRENIRLVGAGGRRPTVPPEASERPRPRSRVARGPWGRSGLQRQLRADVITGLRASSCTLETCTGTGTCLAAARLARVGLWLRSGPTPNAGGQANQAGRHVDEAWGGPRAKLVLLERRRGQLAEARAARGRKGGVAHRHDPSSLLAAA